MATTMGDSIAEEAYNAQTKLATAVLSALFSGGVTAGKAAGRGVKHGAEAAIKRAVEAYYNKERPGEVDREFFAKACQKAHAQSCYMNVSNQDTDRLKDLLVHEGVMFAVWPIPGDNGQLFQFLRRDRAAAMRAVDLLRAGTMQYGQVPPVVLADDIGPGGKVGTISGFTDEEMALFQHFAGKNGLRYATTKDMDGKNIVMFHPDSSRAAQRTKLDVGWTLSGNDGARVREQLVYRLKGIERMTLSLEEGEREAYFACKDKPDHYIHVNADGFTLYDRGEVVHTISRDNADFERLATADILAMSGAVCLTAEQFQNMNPEFLTDMPTMDLFPEGYNEQKEQTELTSYMDLVSLKMSIDDEGNTPWGPGDPSVSYSEFSEFEYRQDMDVAERERGFERYKEACFYREDELEEAVVEREQDSLDDIIADAQSRHDEKFVESMSKNRGWRERRAERQAERQSNIEQ